MKNQYFGDVNDYLKYGLLRVIQKTTGFRIGVCWCLTPDDAGPDGEARGYLANVKKWRRFDPELYDTLRRLRPEGGPRSVNLSAEWGIIPNASYFDAILGSSVAQRTAYFSAVAQAFQGCDLVFLDPDNGIEVAATKYGSRGADKYVYWRELKGLYGEGQSLLIYQHYPRLPRERFVPFLAERLREELASPAVTAFQTARVAFFLVPQAAHVSAFAPAAEVVATQWAGRIQPWAQPSTVEAPGPAAEVMENGPVAGGVSPPTATPKPSQTTSLLRRGSGGRMIDYHINIFYSDEDGGYIADIPDLESCSGFGATPEEALAGVKRARDLWIESARAEHRPVPEPKYRPVIYQTR